PVRARGRAPGDPAAARRAPDDRRAGEIPERLRRRGRQHAERARRGLHAFAARLVGDPPPWCAGGRGVEPAHARGDDPVRARRSRPDPRHEREPRVRRAGVSAGGAPEARVTQTDDRRQRSQHRSRGRRGRDGRDRPGYRAGRRGRVGGGVGGVRATGSARGDRRDPRGGLGVSRRRVPTLLSVGALLFGCGAERRATEPPSAPSPSGAPTAPHSEPLAQPPRGELEADEVVQRALAMIAEIRELGPKAPVRGEVIARQAMLDYVQRQFRTELPPEVVEGSGEVLVALGAVPPEFDYERALLDLMSAQLAGFYEPKDKTMYLAADLEGAEREATLAHELVHAL